MSEVNVTGESVVELETGFKCEDDSLKIEGFFPVGENHKWTLFEESVVVTDVLENEADGKIADVQIDVETDELVVETADSVVRVPFEELE